MSRPFTARQPIFNKKQYAKAYALNFEQGIGEFHSYICASDPKASLDKALLELTDGRPAVLTFDKDTFLSGLIELLPKNDVVINISDHMQPCEAVVNYCRALFHWGYTLCISDVVFMYEWDKIYPFVKIVRFDMQTTPLDSLLPLIPTLKEQKIKILAQQVNDHTMHKMCLSAGFDFFQGDFFLKLDTVVDTEINNEEAFIMTLYQEVMKEPINYTAVNDFFQHDVTLSYKLFRYVNSAIFELPNEIKSIKQALAYLGEDSLRRFICLVTTAHLNKNKPAELTKFSILRARFCQLTANKLGYQQDIGFLTGLFSCLDAIMDRPMSLILKQLPISVEISDALIDNSGPYAALLQLVKYYEKGAWMKLDKLATEFNLSSKDIANCYNEGIDWCKTYEEVNPR